MRRRSLSIWNTQRIAQSKGEIIVTLDGDHSYPVDAISYLLEVYFHSGVRFVSASRFPLKNRNAMSTKHWIGNKILSAVRSVLYFRWVSDSQSGMWVFRRDALPKFQPQADTMALSQEIKILAFTNREVRCLEMPIYYGQRVGESKLNLWRDGFGYLLQLLTLRLTLGRRRRAAAKVTPFPQPQGQVAGDERVSAGRR